MQTLCYTLLVFKQHPWCILFVCPFFTWVQHLRDALREYFSNFCTKVFCTPYQLFANHSAWHGPGELESAVKFDACKRCKDDARRNNPQGCLFLLIGRDDRQRVEFANMFVLHILLPLFGFVFSPTSTAVATISMATHAGLPLAHRQTQFIVAVMLQDIFSHNSQLWTYVTVYYKTRAVQPKPKLGQRPEDELVTFLWSKVTDVVVSLQKHAVKVAHTTCFWKISHHFMLTITTHTAVCWLLFCFCFFSSLLN